MEIEEITFLDGYEHYLNKLNNREYFSLIKLNHGFLEYFTKKKYRLEQIEKWMCQDLIDCILYNKEIILNDPRIILALGIQGHEVIQNYDKKLIKEIKKLFPGRYSFYCALTFKRNFVDGKQDLFLDAIKDYNVVGVGLTHLKSFGEGKLPNYKHFKIEIGDHLKKEKILNTIIDNHQKDTVYLLQCGELFSSWLILNLYNKLDNAFILDMGRAMDYNLDKNYDIEDQKKYRYLTRRLINYQPWLDSKYWKKLKFI